VTERQKDIEARIRAQIERNLGDPEWQESMRQSLVSMRAGRVLPTNVAMWSLSWPRWLVWVAFHWIAPWTWGRRIRRLSKQKNAMSGERP
jgi:hypothetical protein